MWIFYRNPDLFQSTLSVRRATGGSGLPWHGGHISIHALRKESDVDAEISGRDHDISIHALRKESDLAILWPFIRLGYISIHALRKESDGNKFQEAKDAIVFQSTLSVRRATRPSRTRLRHLWDFNPRSP